MIQTEPVFFTFIQLLHSKLLIQVYFRDWNFRFLLSKLVICGVIITYRRETRPN